MIAILSAVIGGLIYRWRGGAFFSAPRVARLGLWTLGIVGLLILGGIPWYIALGAGVLVYLSQSTGHGAHMEFGTGTQAYAPGDTEKLTFWLPYIKPEWLHDLIGMTVVGLVRGLPAAGVLTWYVGYSAGAIALTGWALTGVVYGLSTLVMVLGLRGKSPFAFGAEVGEVLTGALVYGGLALAMQNTISGSLASLLP